MQKLIRLSLTLIITALFLTGCTSTMNGAESDIKDGVSMVESDVNDGMSMVESGAEGLASDAESMINSKN